MRTEMALETSATLKHLTRINKYFKKNIVKWRAGKWTVRHMIYNKMLYLLEQ